MRKLEGSLELADPVVFQPHCGIYGDFLDSPDSVVIACDASLEMDYSEATPP